MFQETYHRGTYAAMHPPQETSRGTISGGWTRRPEAIEAGCDDVGIGALFGLYGWRFEVLGLVAHSRHLQKHLGVGPHTISFPRLCPALGVDIRATTLSATSN